MKKKYTLRTSFGGTAYGDFCILNPSSTKSKNIYNWLINLIKKNEKRYFFPKLFTKKKNKINETIINLNMYKSPAVPTIIFKDEKKFRSVYVYTDIWARDFKMLNLKEKYIGKFEIRENKLAICDASYVKILNSPDISKYAKNLKIDIKEYIKRLNEGYLEVKLKNGIYDTYEISDRKVSLDPKYDLIMSSNDDELDPILLRGCCFKIKK